MKQPVSRRPRPIRAQFLPACTLTIIPMIVLMCGKPLVVRAEPDRTTSGTAITHVTVIDGTGAVSQPDMTVVIRGDRIVAVAAANCAAIPADAVVVDGRGKFLIPGLWDMHVHLAKAGENSLPLYIANGITSVRDMGGDFAKVLKWRSEIAAGRKLGPRIKTAGPILESATHVDGMKRRGTLEPVEQTRIAVADVDAASAAVEFVDKLGADFIKVRTVQSSATYRAIAEAAERVKLPLVGHAVASPEEMVRAGQRSIEHLLIPPLDNLTEQQRGDLFKQFVEHGIAVVPTLVNGEKSLFVSYEDAAAIVEDSDGKVDPRRRYLSGYLIEDWREQLAEKKSRPPIDWKSLAPRLLRDLVEMRRAGVRIMPGTDVAVLLIFPGFTLHDELELFVRELKMSNMEVLVSATQQPAEFFGLQDQLGTVEAGKHADLVLLDADPLEDIRNTQRINAVVVNGKYMDRAAIDTTLSQVESNARKQRASDSKK